MMSELSAAGEFTMPNRTIYVADADLPIFEKAQQLAGDNLSATIVQALRRFVESEEARASGYQEITITVGKGKPYLQKQFRGRLLIKRRLALSSKARVLSLEVYQTIHGRFALYSRNLPDRDWSISGWGEAYEPEERRLDVFENLEALKETIPEEMYESIVRYLQQGDEIEFLDI